jgi:hypothetical protein
VWKPTYQYTLAAYVFVPSVFGENIPTAEFGMISAETACWDIHRKKRAKFLIWTFTCRSTFLYACHHGIK